MKLSDRLEAIASGEVQNVEAARRAVGGSVHDATQSLKRKAKRLGDVKEGNSSDKRDGTLKKGHFTYQTGKRSGAMHRHLIKNGFKLSSTHTSRGGEVSMTYVHPKSNVAVHHSYNKNAKGETRHGSVTVYRARPRTKKPALPKKKKA